MAVKVNDLFVRRVKSVAKSIKDGQIFIEAGQEWIDNDVVPRAQALAPKATGNLANSIGGNVNENQIRIYADADYASFVEHGTSKTAAQPFLTPAVIQTRDKLTARMRKKLNDRLNKA